jgi:taurine-pyruvate aminotransferase
MTGMNKWPVDGVDREAVVQQDVDNVFHPMVQHSTLSQKQLVIVTAKDSTVVDASGREYLDAMSGLWCVNIGYGRDELADIAAAQMRSLAYYPHTAMNAPAAALAERVNGLLGGSYHLYFSSSGSEANEVAFKVARQYWKHEAQGSYRFKTISRYQSYHGATLGTLAAGGIGERKKQFEPLGTGDFVKVVSPYCYRCPLGLAYPSCELACVKNMESVIQGEAPDTVATVLIEPIMSALGVVVPPDEYLPAVADLCKKYGILLHVDEVINGFGRTGRPFAYQHYGVKPDLVSMAKGISSAYQPIAATAVVNRVFESFLGTPTEGRQVMQINTYGGHPVASAVADRNVQIMVEEDLIARSESNGDYLLAGLSELKRLPYVGDARGKGLYAALELVVDKQTKVPMPPAEVNAVLAYCEQQGVIVGKSAYPNSTVVLAPPLIITRPEIDRIVSTLEQAVRRIAL